MKRFKDLIRRLAGNKSVVAGAFSIALALVIVLVFLLFLSGCQTDTLGTDIRATSEGTTAVMEATQDETTQAELESVTTTAVESIEDISDEYLATNWNGLDAWAVINNNEPFFTNDELLAELGDSFEYYAPLDDLGRCGVCYALVGAETIPTEPRGEIGNVRPTGWHTVRYDDLIADHYLYNRCHLLGYQLTGENANTQNLITGTRYLNVIGMLPFENEIAAYEEANPNNHVLYRVTPIFLDDNLVAEGVLMEARSVEDDGVCFNVFCFNVQPGIEIDYLTGDSWANGEEVVIVEATTDDHEAVYEDYQVSNSDVTYILNTNSMRFHDPDCEAVDRMADQNRAESTLSRDELIAEGYTPCGICNP